MIGIVVGSNDPYSIFERMAGLSPTGGRSIRIGVNDPYSLLLAILARLEEGGASGLVEVHPPNGAAISAFNPAADTDEERGIALMAAIDASPVGSTILVGSGSFRLSGAPAINQRHLIGRGQSTDIYNSDGENNAALEIQSGSVSSVRLRDMEVLCGDGAQSFLSDVKILTSGYAGMYPVVLSSNAFEFHRVAIIGHSSKPSINGTGSYTIKCYGCLATTEPSANVTVTPPGGLFVDPAV